MSAKAGVMMKRLTILLTALLSVGVPLFSSPASSSTEQVALAQGSESVARIRAAYEKGDYQDFLESMEADLHRAKSNTALKQLTQMREEIPAEQVDRLSAEYEKSLQTLQQQRDQELEAVCHGGSDLFCQKVENVVHPVLSEKENLAFEKIHQLRFHPVGSGKNSDENAMIDIDLATEFKLVHLSALGKTPEVKRELSLVLKMEEMDRFAKAAAHFQDGELKEAVMTAERAFDRLQAKHWDLADLRQLSSGRMKPSSSEEEAVAKILSQYDSKRSDLYQKEFLDQL
jgi:hypothetical protein